MSRILPPGAAVLLAVSFLLSAAPAIAASAPANDTFSGATVITSLPFTDQLDTTAATTDSTDAEANANCGAPATAASVWYAYTPSSDQGIVVDASGSSYSTGIIVVTGEPGGFVLQTCGPVMQTFSATSGTTYHILVFGDDPSVNGGQLDLKVDLLPPPPTLTASLSPTGTVNTKTGVVTIAGTIDCTDLSLATIGPNAAPGPGASVDVYVDVRQNVGRIFTVTGSGYASVSCGSSVPFSVLVAPSSGLFKPGKVTASVNAFYCNIGGCASDYRTASVRIRR